MPKKQQLKKKLENTLIIMILCYVGTNVQCNQVGITVHSSHSQWDTFFPA